MRMLERLKVFVLARELAVRVYRMTRVRPLCRHPVLADQLARAAVSIPANIAEAYALGTAAQLVRGLRIAYGSAAELQTLLWIAGRSDALPPEGKVSRITGDAEQVVRMLVGLLKHHGARVGR
jgi:four helix bundle protein